jgi:hypothetical protein
MTRKHFIAMAAALKAADANYDICREMAGFCSSQNGNFDFGRFMDACGHG